MSSVLEMLRSRKRSTFYQSLLIDVVLPVERDPALATKLIEAIRAFQNRVQGAKSPDGLVSPAGSTILFLGGIRNRGKQIVVDLDDQNLYAYEGIKKSHEFYAVSGDSDHPTATKPELHHVFRKHEKYRSRTYDAQMNYAMFFTKDGKAIHQSNAVGVSSILKSFGISSLGSHGCVRLEESNAKKLFAWTPMNTPVFVDMH